MKLNSPTRAEIERAVSAVKRAGVAVGVVEITRDGTIRVLPAIEEDTRKPEQW